MIIVRLMGGLGNQLFQYAFARALSIEKNVELKLDLNFLNDKTFKENFTYRDFELDKFNLEFKFATKFEINKFSNSRFNNLLCKLSLKKNNVYLNERTYNHQNVKVLNDIYLDGYWQSELYFENYKKIIIKDLKFKDVNKVNNSFYENYLYNNQNTVSVHIRRGDYVQNLNINAYHGTCDTEYYNKAINFINSKIKNPIFFFFSDDIDWVIKNFGKRYNYNYIDFNTENNNYLDMFLMSKCSHNIIANSSFSWWGAYLNQNSNKYVIAPNKWFVDSKNDPPNIIPKTWIRL
jgi:hypothetical protein